MKLLGIVLSVVAYIQGINAMFYFGIMPAIAGAWNWSDYGISLIIGLAIFSILNILGQYLRRWARHVDTLKSCPEEKVGTL